MANNQGVTSSLDDMESVQLATITMRREYSKKMSTLHSKNLDLKFQNLIKTKYILEDNGPSNQTTKVSENNIDLSLIKEPSKINISLIHENDMKSTINEALKTLALIDEIKNIGDK